jgi:hypothetical protein
MAGERISCIGRAVLVVPEPTRVFHADGDQQTRSEITALPLGGHDP